MKITRILTTLFAATLLFASNSFSQCGYNNSLYAAALDPVCGVTSAIVSDAWGGDYLITNVQEGNTYTWTTCGDGDFDTQLTLYDNLGTTVLAYNDDDCGVQSTIIWTATFTGQVHVLLDEYNCASNTTPMTITASCTNGCPSSGANQYFLCEGGTVNACSGTIYDAGGPGDYPAGDNSVMTFCSGSSDQVQFDFTSFNIDPNDNIQIFDGTTTVTTPTFTGNTNPGSVFSTTGCLTVMFFEDGATQGPGFTATLSCPTCSDGVQNQGETSVDCGGPICGPCSSCYDGVQNNGETGIDCGGVCEPCHCSDGIQSGDETGVDCGGSCDQDICPIPCNVVATAILPGGCCDYTLVMDDSYGDGWSNNRGVTVFVNGSSIGEFRPTVYTATQTISVCHGDAIQLDYESGSFEGENTYYLQDADGNTIFSDGPNPSTGTVFNTSAVCNGGGLSCQGGMVEIVAQGEGAFTYALENDFDDGAAGDGWITTSAAVFNNPCDASFDGGTYMWMGNSSPHPREVTTDPLDMSCGGEICFWLDFATQGNASPCEGIDLGDEGVYFQYSLDGTNWINIEYFGPEGVGNTTSGSGTNPQMTSWNQYCYTIPAGAETASTQFQWAQTGSSGNNNDHWGIDNVTISSLVDCTPYVYDWDMVAGNDNDSNQFVNVTQSGVYTVTYTNGNDGCETSVSITVPASFTVTANTTQDETCPGDCDGTASSSVSGGTAPFTYLWSDGQTTQNAVGLCAGTYTVTYTDAVSCTDVGTITITPGEAPVADATADGPYCLTNLDGSQNSFSFDGTGSTGTITTYDWDFDDGSTGSGSTTTHSYASSGTYDVTLTVSNGSCDDETVVSIIVNDVPTLTLDPTDLSCNGAADGEIVATSSNGTPTYTYLWSGPGGFSGTGSSSGNSDTESNLEAGTYIVTVSDNNSCLVTATETLVEPSAITLTVAGNDASCNGASDGDVTATATGGTAPLDYQWGNNAGFATSATVTGLLAGTYNVTITDASNCTVTDNVVISEPSAITLTMNANDANCGNADGDADVTVAGGTAPYGYNWSNGSTAGNSITAITAGSYSVTVTDALGCSNTASVNVADAGAPTLTIINVVSVTCNGDADGEAEVTVAGGTAPFTYIWSNGSTDAHATGLAGGTATVTVTDGAATPCIATQSVTISEPSPIIPTVLSSNGPSCLGNSDGTANIGVNGGLSPYTYNWTSGETTQNASGLAEGTSTVTITDVNLCTTITTVNLSVSPSITITSTSQDALCTGSNDGEGDITVTGGNIPYGYQWSNGATTEDLSALAPGAFTVTVTDNNGCTETHTITISQPTPVSVTLNCTDVTTINGSDGTSTATANGGTPGFEFTWNVSGTTTNQVTGLPVGNVSVTAIDDNGCTATTTCVINGPNCSVTAISSVTDAACLGATDGTATAEMNTGGTAPFTYAWDAAAGGQATQTATGLTSGVYTVTITDDNDCFITTNATVSEGAGITVTTNPTNVNCNGSSNGNITANVAGGNPGYTFEWNNGQTTQLATGIGAGNYSVTVADINGCLGIDNITLSQPAAITTSIAGTDVTCPGSNDGSATALATGGTSPYNYQWDDNAFQTTQTAVGIGADTLHVTITDVNGCTNIDSIKINEPAVITATLSSTQSSCGQSDGTATVDVVTNGTAPYTYLWDDSNSQTGQTAMNIPSGTYNVTITDNDGCQIVENVAINDASGPVPIASTDQNVSCFGGSDGAISVLTTGGLTPYTYNWTNTGTSTAVTGVTAGTHTVTVTDDNGCTASSSTDVTEPDQLIASITSFNHPSCFGDSNGDATASVSGGVGPFDYVWSNGSTANPAINLGEGVISLTITDANNCTVETDVTLIEPAQLTSNIVSANATCNGFSDGNADLTVSGGTSPLSYSWTNGSNTEDLSLIGNGIYDVTINDASGCTLSDGTTITEPAAITATITGFNDVSCNSVCDGDATVAGNGGTPPYTYAWNPSGQSTPSATNLCVGVYDVSVIDQNNCPGITNVTISGPSSLSITLNGTNLSCSGANDGTASTTINGGTPPYDYLWSTIQTTASISGLSANVYGLSVTDLSGCEISESITITEPLELIITTSSTESNCGQADGSATIFVTQGVAPYSYLWDANAGNQTTATASNVTSGSYNATVTDGNGCTKITAVGVTDAGAPSANILTQGDVSCFGGSDGFAQVTVGGGATPYSFNWNNGGTNQSVTGLSAGSWTSEITDNVGCVATVNVTINEPTQVVATISNSTDVSCFGGSDGTATALGNGGTPPYTYAWNNGQTTQMVTGLTPATHVVAVTDANNCFANTSVTIDQPLQMALSTSVTDAFCNTATGEVCITTTNGTSPYSYNWSNGQNSSCAVSLVPNGYSVTVTDNNGCNVSISDVVGNIPGGTASIANVIGVSCFGGNDGQATVSLSGGQTPYSVLWDNNAGFQTSTTATGLSAGDYDVTITDANNCTSADRATIVQPTAITVTPTITDAACNGDCNGSIFADADGGTNPFTYEWNDALQQNSSTATGLCAGNYILTVTDNNGCVEILNETIAEPTAILLDSTVVNSNCTQNDGEVCITASGGTPNYSYAWPGGETTNCLLNVYSAPYTVTVTDNNGCQESLTAVVSDIAGPIATIISVTDVSCFNGSDGSLLVSVSGGSGNYTYEWKDVALNTIGTTPSLNNVPAGSYSIEVKDFDTQCSSTDAAIINQPSQLQFNPSFVDPTCFGYNDGSANVIVAGGTSPYTYQWSASPIQATSEATGLNAGTYSVDILDANGCSQTLNYTLTNPDQVTASITTTDVLCFEECNGTATLLGANGITNNYTYAWDNSQVSQTALNLCVGAISGTVTDNNGCSAIANANINQPSELIALINQSGDVTCYGGNDGFIQLTTLGGTPGYSYNWPAGVSTSSTATGLSSNLYYITVTDANNCSTIVNEQINQPAQLISNIINSSDVTCFDACDGTAQVSASGGVAPYFYQWDVNGNLQQTANASSLCANNGITVTVTDNKGCSTTSQVDISQPPALTVTYNVVQSHCGLADGEVSMSVVGGTAPYVYDWADPSLPSTPNINNVPAGCYTVDILDAQACEFTEIACINDISGPTITYINHSDVTCFGGSDGVINTNVFGGTPPYQNISWFDQNNNNIANGAVGVTFLEGNLTYFEEVTDAAGCIATFTQFIDQPDPVVSAIVNQHNVSCFGGNDGSATVVAGGGTIPYTYLWNPTSQTSTVATGLSAGVYTVLVEDANGCTNEPPPTVTITEPDLIVPTATLDHVDCYGDNDGSITYTAIGGTGLIQYFWTPNNIDNPNSFANGLYAGSYDVILSDQYGCTVTDNQVLTQPNQLVASISATPASCTFFNGSATVHSVSGGIQPYSYQWNNSVNTNPTYSGLYHGTYDVIVSDNNLCNVNLSVTVNDQPGPVITSMSFTQPLCFGDCNGTATVNFSGGTNPVLPHWSDLGSQSTSTATNLCSGNYCVTVTDANGCVSSDCILVTETDLFEANGQASKNILCEGETTQIWGAPVGGTWPYPNDTTKIVWDHGSLNYNYGPHTISPNPGTTTFYNFTVTDGNGCQATDQIEITVSSPLNIAAPDSTEICIGSTADICFTGEGGTSINDYVYTWTYDQHQDVDSTQTCSNVSPTADTWYYVILEDGCSTPVYDSSLVIVHPIPPSQFSAPNIEGCPPFEANFSGVTSSDFPNATFHWDFQNNGEFVEEGQFPTYIYENSGTYTVSLLVISEEGCEGPSTQPDYITVYPSPIADFLIHPDSVVELTNPFVSTDASPTIGGDSLLTWDFNDPISTSTYEGETASHLYSDTAHYPVVLTAINTYGCLDVDTMIVQVKPDFAIYAPNAFTPNDDNINDGFRLKGVGIDKFQLLIYDRWGEIVFESKDLYEEWDGHAKGGKKIAQNGVYVWKAIVTPIGKTTTEEFIGTVTLVR